MFSIQNEKPRAKKSFGTQIGLFKMQITPEISDFLGVLESRKSGQNFHQVLFPLKGYLSTSKRNNFVPPRRVSCCSPYLSADDIFDPICSMVVAQVVEHSKPGSKGLGSYPASRLFASPNQ